MIGTALNPTTVAQDDDYRRHVIKSATLIIFS